MPEITSCPECEKKLRVPDDLLGKKVKCPGCSNMFTATAIQASPPKRREPEIEEDEPSRRSRSEGISARRREEREEDDREERPARRARLRRDDEEDEDEDRPRRRRRDEEEDEYEERPRGEGAAWRGVRAGLNLVVISCWLGLALVGVYVLGAGLLVAIGAAGAAAAGGGGGGPGQGPAAALGVGMCLFLCTSLILGGATVIVQLIGTGMCMQVPPRRGSPARGLAIGAFCCICAMYLFIIGAMLIGFTGGFAAASSRNPAGMLMASGIGQVVTLFGYFLGFVGFVLWIFFLRATCLMLRNSAVAQKVMLYFIVLMCFTALSIIMTVVMVLAIGSAVASATNPGAAAGSIGAGVIGMFVGYGLMALVSLGLLVWYVLILIEVRTVVERHLSRR